MYGASQLVAMNLFANAGTVRDAGSIPGWGSFPAGSHSNPPQYSCLENPMHSGASWAIYIVHRVTENRIRLKRLRTAPCIELL